MRLCTLGCAAVMLLTGPAGADTESLTALFARRAPITAVGGAASRLELSAEVLGACRPDLADLRIVDADGREVPFLIDSPERAGTAVGIRYEAVPEVVDVDRSRDAVGDGITLYRERFLLAVPPLPADVPAWEVVLEVARPEFVSSLDAVAVAADGTRTAIVAAGSIFRLPTAGAERLAFVVPVPNAVRLEVTLSTDGGGFLAPRFALRAGRILPEPTSSAVPLAVLETLDLSEATEVVLDRPRGIVPRRLAVSTSTGTFHRRVTVWDEGPGAEAEPLGASAVVRIAGSPRVEMLEVPLRPPRGDRLRLVIDDRDSPPLEDLAFAALMPRPVLVFWLPAGASSATLLFGGGRAQRPHYDLASLDWNARQPVAGDEAARAVAVLDPAAARPATLGAVAVNPGWDPEPVLAFAMHPGAAVDARRFEHRRRLEVVPSAEGLSRLRLEPEDVALLRPDLADLRVVDPDGRQWAYLRQDRARTVATPLPVASRKREGRASVYGIEVPDGALAVERLELEVEAPYFDRDFVLRGRLGDGAQRELARGRLVRRAGDPRPATIAVEPRRVEGLELEIVDGDDAPLEVVRAEAWSTVPDLYLAAVPGGYDLLLGDPDADSPVYELERVRSTILAVPAAGVVRGELEANPAYSATGRLARSDAWQKILLWAVLGLAVVVLAAITLRAARS